MLPEGPRAALSTAQLDWEEEAAALGRCDEAEKALAEACALDGANKEIARKLAEVRRANKLRRSGGLFRAAGDYAAEEQRLSLIHI